MQRKIQTDMKKRVILIVFKPIAGSQPGFSF